MRIVLLFGVALLLLPTPVFAQGSASNNYRMDETALGQSGLPDSASSSYKGKVSLGDIGVGDSSSTNYNASGGSQTSNDPALTFSVNSSSVSFPTFATNAASMASTTFSVTNYTSFGYIVLISGSPPTYASHSITPMATAGTSSTGFEQFGINLVANTSPQSIGANPNQGQFGFGVAAAGYDTANNYKYVDGGTIASAPKSSGKTDFTISYLINVGSLTPGGQYTTHNELIVVGTY
jgi:hypothetical protein